MATDALVERNRLINAEQAKLVKTEYVPGSRRIKEIHLFWPISDKKMALSSLEYLSTHCSTLNKNTKRQWVVDPMGGIEEYQGTYRQVALRLTKHGDAPGILQVLRLGWLTELSTEETRDDEARFLSLTRDMCTQKLNLTRMWVNIDPEYLAKIELARKTTVNVINPQCEVLDADADPLMGQKRFAARFAVSERKSDTLHGQHPGDPDAICTLYEILQEVSLPTSLADLSALTPEYPKYDNEYKRIFTVATGDFDVLVLEYKFMDVLARGYLMGESEANLQTLVTGGAYTAWATSTAYAFGQRITNGGVWYRCIVAHTSGTFATDLSNGKWTTTNTAAEASDFMLWVTGQAYTVGQKITQGTTRYMCAIAHTAGTFATDLVAGKWTTTDGWTYATRGWKNENNNTATFTVFFQRVKWQSGSAASDALIITQQTANGRYNPGLTRVWLRRTKAAFDALVHSSSAWVTGTAYAVGDCVTNSGLAYVCLTAHTASALFATDLALVRWLLVSTAWANSTVYTVGQRVSSGGSAYVATITHTSVASPDVFATDLAAGKWILTTATGEALNNVTYAGVTYKHLRWDAQENQWDAGSYNVTQTLSNPDNTTNPHDLDTSHIYDTHEELLYRDGTGGIVLRRTLVETLEKITASALGAYVWADDSDVYYEFSGNGGALSVQKTKGKVTYLGNSRWRSWKVALKTIAGTDAWGTPAT